MIEERRDKHVPKASDTTVPQPTDARINPAPESPPSAANVPAIDASSTPAKLVPDVLLSDQSEIGLEVQRRSSPRLPFSTVLTVHHIDASDSVSDGLRCPALDISAGGLCFRSRRCYWKNDRLLILIRTKDRSTRIVFVTVRHSAYEGGGNHRVGVQFIESPKSKRILSWLAENVVE